MQACRNNLWGYMDLYKAKAAESLDVVVFEVKEMKLHVIRSYIYEMLSAAHGVKEIQMKRYRKHAVVVFNPKEIRKEHIRLILKSKMHFIVREIEYKDAIRYF